MASLLETFMRKSIAQGFKGKLLNGLIWRPQYANVNEFGDPITTGFDVFTFQGIRDNFDKKYAATAGIPTTDVRILMIAGLISPVTAPRIGDKVRIRGDAGQQQWHEVRGEPEVDPANAHFVLQCFEIEEPVTQAAFASLDFSVAANSQYIGQVV